MISRILVKNFKDILDYLVITHKNLLDTTESYVKKVEAFME